MQALCTHIPPPEAAGVQLAAQPSPSAHPPARSQDNNHQAPASSLGHEDPPRKEAKRKSQLCLCVGVQDLEKVGKLGCPVMQSRSYDSQSIPMCD